MKKFFSLTVIILLGCKERPNVTATIENLEGAVIIQYAPVNDLEKLADPMQDTILSNNGKFKYSLPAEEPHLLTVTPLIGTFQRKDGSSYHPRFNDITLFIKPEDRIEITGRVNKYFTEYAAKGSRFNEDITLVRQRYIKEASKAVKIELEIDSMTFEGEEREVIQEKFKQRNNLFNLAKSYQLEYIRNNVDSELSAYYILRQPLDTLGKYFSILSSEVRQGQFSRMLNYMLNEQEQYIQTKANEESLLVGSPFRPFSLTAISGEEIRIDSIKTDYLIMDFWGSWCGPCIKGIPKMKEYYTKYQDNIEIVAIACNDSRSEWTKTVEDFDLPWINLINREAPIDNNVAVLYGVMAYPTKFIIDSKGIVVGKFSGEGERFYAELDEKMKDAATR